MRSKDNADQRWREAILGQRRSGLTIKEFCEQRKLCQPSFYVKRKEFGLKNEIATISKLKGFIQIKPPLPLKIGPALELRAIIETPNGYRVHAGLIGADGLKNVLDVIQCM